MRVYQKILNSLIPAEYLLQVGKMKSTKAVSDLRSIIKSMISEAVLGPPSKLDQTLMHVDLKLTMRKGAHVPDTLTRIRVLPTVSVVGQIDKVIRNPTGSTTLQVYVKFLPSDGDVYDNVKRLAQLVKKLPDMEIVKVLTVDDQAVLYKGKPIVV